MRSQYTMITCATAAIVAVGCFGNPQPVQARGGLNGFAAGVIGGAVAGGLLGGIGRGGHGRRGGRATVRRGKGGRGGDVQETSDDGGNKRKGNSEQVLASIGAPSSGEQMAVLKTINSSEVLGVVGSTKDLHEVGKTVVVEEERDYTQKIKDLITKVKKAQQDANDKTPGDITEHAIEQSLDKAYKAAKLQIFESFLNENWSAERLRVMILDRVDVEIGRLFVGNNRGNAPMEELDNLIQRAAASVYRRIFETSELLAANRGAVLFVQNLYTTHGGLVDDQLREVTDGMITSASNAAIAKFDALMRRDENGFALRYRAQRIVFDCLSENMATISSSETSIASPDVIKRNIAEMASTTCMTWLQNQFGAEQDKLNPQKPMPLRVVWSATGPKDDPTMYGRTTGSF
jgi:hypothetical protein